MFNQINKSTENLDCLIIFNSRRNILPLFNPRLYRMATILFYRRNNQTTKDIINYPTKNKRKKTKQKVSSCMLYINTKHKHTTNIQNE